MMLLPDYWWKRGSSSGTGRKCCDGPSQVSTAASILKGMPRHAPPRLESPSPTIQKNSRQLAIPPLAPSKSKASQPGYEDPQRFADISRGSQDSSPRGALTHPRRIQRPYRLHQIIRNDAIPRLPFVPQPLLQKPVDQGLMPTNRALSDVG
jgi:hypothetical protein